MTWMTPDHYSENPKGISAAILKMIALITMLIDHVGAVVVYRMLTGGFFQSEADWDHWFLIYRIMRGIGRMAFPIYCFLLVEGFVHTRNRWKYARNLLLFALISEVPFDLAVNQMPLEFTSNNVFFELFLGLMMIWGVDRVQNWIRTRSEGETGLRWRLLRAAAALLAYAVFGLLAEYVLSCDYGMAGIAAILVIYLMGSMPLTGFILAVIVLTIGSSTTEIYAMAMAIPIMLYNGSRGRQNGLKYVFYAFYPVHLLILAVICMSLGI